MRLLAAGLLSALLFCLSLPASAGCKDADGQCLLGVFPHTSIRQIESTYSPMVEELSLVLDRDVDLATTSSIARFLEGLRQQHYDVAFAGLGHFVMVGEPVGYHPLARREQPLHYEIITVAERHIPDLDALKGRRLGLMPDENGTTIASALLLVDSGYHPYRDFKVKRFPSQQACIHGLLADLTDACGIAGPVVSIFESRLKRTFQVLAESPAWSNVAYIASPNLSEEQVKQLRDYFASRQGFVAATSEDYAEFRRQIERFKALR